MEAKEERIRRITRLYYSNKKVQEAILKFSLGREVVPKYFEAFGKRPDTLQYMSDIDNLVRKGATSFHASEEIWEDPLQISSEWTREEMNNVRKGWDLVIDIDSKYLDLAKILAILIIEALEKHDINNYWAKFSGSKGWHIIVPGEAFPEEFNGFKTRNMFPEWPRAICSYLMNYVKKDYNRKAKEVMGGIEKIKKETNLSEKDFVESNCPQCGKPAKKGKLITLKCHECSFSIKRKDMKINKRKLMCPQENCAGSLEKENEEDYFQCPFCNDVSSINKRESSGKYKAIFTKAASASEDFEEEVKGNVFGASDLVLVAPRHLFRMPYSLHEKSALASVIVSKNEIEIFDPVKDADPLKINVRNFILHGKTGEAINLLSAALEWKKTNELEEEKSQKTAYKSYEQIDLKGVTEEMFPLPIKKLLKGLKEGKKRGLFVLITFLRSLNFPPEYMNQRIREWNKLNEPPLKEGYIKGQIDWHLKQRKQILPPNYSNDNFYKDLGILDEKPKAKNPIVEVMRKVRKNN